MALTKTWTTRRHHKYVSDHKEKNWFAEQLSASLDFQGEANYLIAFSHKGHSFDGNKVKIGSLQPFQPIQHIRSGEFQMAVQESFAAYDAILPKKISNSTLDMWN